MATIITELQKEGISFFPNGSEIRFKAAAGAPSDAMLRTLSLRRDEVAQYLRARDSVGGSPVTHSRGQPVPSPVQEMWWNWIDRDTSLTLSLIEFVRQRELDPVIAAIREITTKHEALRASFRETAGILLVTFNPVESFEMEVEILPSSVSRDVLKARVDEFTGRPLTAGSQWLVRGKVFGVPGYGHVAVIVANHLVVDGTSMDIMRRELRRYLNGTAPTEVKQGTLRYRDFAQWQRDRLARSGDALSIYWRSWTRNQQEILSPSTRAPLRWQSGRKVRRTFTIPPFAQAAVVDAARRYATFPFLVYLTLFSLSIAHWSGQRAFPVRCICDGRVRPELAAMVGLMTGADAVSINIDPSADFPDLLRHVEREYHAAARLRLPNIYAFPPFATKPELDVSMQDHNVAVVLNYRKATGHAGEPHQPSEGADWPPPEGQPRHDHWRHVVSPICLELTQLDGVATAAFLLHEDILSVPEQDALIQSFFAIFWAKLLEGRREPSSVPDGQADVLEYV